MSAYIVGKRHIDALVHAALERGARSGGFSWYVEGATTRAGTLDEGNAHEVGTMLWSENVKSVMARYPASGGDDLPGPGDFTPGDADNYLFAPMRDPLTVVETLKAIAAYEYQACEHDGWRTSGAFAFCDALRHACIDELPGYDEAEWGVADDRR